MGQGLIGALWAIGAGALALGAGAAPAAGAAEASSCKMVTVGELPVRFERNRPLVQVKINGTPLWFLVDTGAGLTTMFSDAAASHGLRTSTDEYMSFSGVGGTQQGRYAVVKEAEFAGAKVKDLKLLVVGLAGHGDLAGLLGRDFLGHWDVEFDLGEKVIRLLAPQHCGSQSEAYWTEQAIEAELEHDEVTAPYVLRMKINGKPFKAEIDSGADTSIITTSAARELGVGVQSLGKEVELTRGITGRPVEVRIGVFDKLAIGGEQIGHARLQVADMFAANRRVSTGSMLERHDDDEDRDQPAMLLGADYLRSHRVLLSSSQKVFYATYNGGPIFQVVGSAVSPGRSAATGTP